MTDIYLNRGPSGRRKYLILGAILAGAISLLYLQFRPDRDAVSTTAAPPSPAESAASTAVPTSSGSPAALQSWRQLAAETPGPQAREEALRLLTVIADPAAQRELEQWLGDWHIRQLFSGSELTETVLHRVRAGDTLGALATRYRTTPELIAAANGIRGNLIRVGSDLRILEGDFHARVRKTENDLELRLNDRFFKRYAVGTGTGGSTPAGSYEITLRLRHPMWYRPDGQTFPYGHPENLLGTHYLKLDLPGIGLHGTWEPESVGRQSSAGCVRLRNEEIEELYILLPEGSRVDILD